MEDSDKLSTAAKQRNVVSRRQQAAAASNTNEEMRPMLPQQQQQQQQQLQGHKPHVLPGQSFLPSSMLQYSVRDKSDAAAKRRYNVNIPSRMIAVLVLVFMIAPLMTFFYKEVHIHDEHHQPHYKSEKFVNVDTQDVLSHLLDYKQNKNSTSVSGDEGGGNAGEESSSKQPPPPPLSSLKAAGNNNVTETVDATSEDKKKSKSSKEAERKRHLRQLAS
jgi:hypothetical protein